MSDMEAFKAANPGSILGDFVRWYSPRDWVEEDVVDEDGNVTRKGTLSISYCKLLFFVVPTN